MPPRKGWAAVYCRLSKEDEDKAAAESESIRNQRTLLLDWAATHGYHVYKVYTDEDYSGIDRARPGFNAMLNDARQLELAQLLHDSARFYNCQFVIATHSPFLLAMPGARVYDLDAEPVTTRKWTELENVRATWEFFQAHRDEFA